MDAHGVSTDDSLKALTNLFKADLEPERVAAIIIEPVQGEGGFYIAPPAFLQKLREIVSEKYCISIGNLCTFLPQDKVGSFSGFTPQQIMHETMKTLSTSQHLFTTYEELVQAEKELK